MRGNYRLLLWCGCVVRLTLIGVLDAMCTLFGK